MLNISPPFLQGKLFASIFPLPYNCSIHTVLNSFLSKLFSFTLNLFYWLYLLVLPVRLADGKDQYSGRVEIYRNGVWGTVCNSNWTETNGRIVCQQLFDIRSVEIDLSVSVGAGPILMDNVDCSSGQTNLLACSHNGFGYHNCGHLEDVRIKCKPGLSGSKYSLSLYINTIL